MATLPHVNLHPPSPMAPEAPLRNMQELLRLQKSAAQRITAVLDLDRSSNAS